jgi:hypothetical protein
MICSRGTLEWFFSRGYAKPNLFGNLLMCKPDYLISRMVLTQLAAAACRDRPDMEREFVDGDFTKAVHILDDWLRKNVQSKGSQLTFDDLLVRATGEKLNAQYYLEDLSRCYLGKPRTAPVTKPARTRPAQ